METKEDKVAVEHRGLDRLCEDMIWPNQGLNVDPKQTKRHQAIWGFRISCG